MTQHPTQDSKSELEEILKKHENYYRADDKSLIFMPTANAKHLIEAYVTTRVKEAELLATTELRTWYGDMFQQLINQIGYERARQTKDAIEANILTTTTNGKEE